jgi:hypothetical protein
MVRKSFFKKNVKNKVLCIARYLLKHIYLQSQLVTTNSNPGSFSERLKITAMKTIKLLILLALFSLQAGATGYSHNMFVAHKKLQVGKECPSEKIIAKKAKVSKQVKYSVETKHTARFFSTRVLQTKCLKRLH